MTSDAYLHVGMPRFQRLSDAVSIMDQHGIDRALVCAFQTCPDLQTVHQAIVEHPGRFIAAGLPIGGDRTEITAGIRAQFEAGFTGLRVSGDHVRDWPWVLDLIGEYGGFALVCDDVRFADDAAILLDHLDRHEDGLVIGGHFAGPREPGAVAGEPALGELFAHPRFAVNFSRQALFPHDLIEEWAATLIEQVGWERIMWASEAPVLHWRDESIGTAMQWIDRFSPTDAQRQGFFEENARRLLWSRPQREVRDLDLPFDPFDYRVSKPAPMWNFGLALDDGLPGRMLEGWVAWGGPERGVLRHYLEAVLDEHLPPGGGA